MAFKIAQFLNIKIFVYILTVTNIILYTLALLGCISNSPGLPDLHIVSIGLNPTSNDTSADPSQSVRVGYFGVCLKHPALDEGIKCLSTTGYDAPSLATHFSERTIASPSSSSDPETEFNESEIETAIDIALRIQTSFFCYFLTVPALAFLAAAICFTLLTAVHVGPERILRLATLTLLGVSLAGSAAAALVATQIAASLHLAGEVAGDASLGFMPGLTAVAIHWVVVGVSCVVSALVWMMLKGNGGGDIEKGF